MKEGGVAMPSSGKYLKKYTCERNRNFKIAFPNQLVVSIWFEDHDCTEMFDENHKAIEPANETVFAFNQADLCIFNRSTGEKYTDLFCSKLPGFSERTNVVYQITPADFANILFNVSLYSGRPIQMIKNIF
ncbi:MAG: hypothetical protein M0P49_01010 [Bacilli bacterium]|nr:hypothetical protein [Bacilli bacterium]